MSGIAMTGAETSWRVQSFAGRLENRAELDDATGTAGAADAALLLALVEHEGPAALDRVEGAFALVADRPGSDGVLLLRDSLARRPLYWREDGRRIVAGTSLAQVIDNGAGEVDHAALLEWMLYRQVLPPRTLHRGVHALRQGTCIELPGDPQQAPGLPLAVAGLLSAGEVARLAKAGDRELVDELERLLMAAVAKVSEGCDHIGVLLSGGVDSTLVACLARAHAKVTAFSMVTAGGSDLDEAATARATAARLGIAIETVEVDPAAYARLAPAATARLGLPLFHVQNVAFNVGYGRLLERAGELGIGRLLGGDGAGTPFGVHTGRMTSMRWLLPVRRLLARLPAGAVPALQKAALDSAQLPVAMPEMAQSAALAVHMIDGGARSRLMTEALAAAAVFREDDVRMIKAIALTDMVAWLPRFLERAALLGDACGIEITTPYYDRALMSFGLCMPMRGLERRHGMLRTHSIGKWALKQVAARQIRETSFFRHRAAWTTAQGRYVAPLARVLLTADGFLARQLTLGTDELAQELSSHDANALAKLVHLELWGRTCRMRQDPDALGRRLAAATAG